MIRFTARRPGQQDTPEAAMPPAEPAAHDREDHTPVPDDVLYLLYCSGASPVFGATLHEWQDFAATAARVPGSARAAGYGGVRYLLDAIAAATRGKPVAHTVARLLLGGRDKYRVDYSSRTGRNKPTTIASDGQNRWQAFAAQTMVGPASPLPHDIANLVDSSWLLSRRRHRGCRAWLPAPGSSPARVTGPRHGGSFGISGLARVTRASSRCRFRPASGSSGRRKPVCRRGGGDPGRGRLRGAHGR